jgi:hypothetical protein
MPLLALSGSLCLKTLQVATNASSKTRHLEVGRQSTRAAPLPYKV